MSLGTFRCRSRGPGSIEGGAVIDRCEAKALGLWAALVVGVGVQDGDGKGVRRVSEEARDTAGLAGRRDAAL